MSDKGAVHLVHRQTELSMSKQLPVKRLHGLSHVSAGQWAFRSKQHQTCCPLYRLEHLDAPDSLACRKHDRKPKARQVIQRRQLPHQVRKVEGFIVETYPFAIAMSLDMYEWYSIGG